MTIYVCEVCGEVLESYAALHPPTDVVYEHHHGDLFTAGHREVDDYPLKALERRIDELEARLRGEGL